MNLTQLRHITPVSAPSTAQPVQPQVDGNADSVSEMRPHHAHGHGGGHLQQALMSALNSVGLTAPGSGAATGSAAPTGDSTGTYSTGADPTGTDSAIKADLQKFVQELGQSIQSSSATTTGTSSSDPKSRFGAGLSALVSQAANGNAPADLQSAFAKLSSDLQAAESSTATARSPAAPPTLQALLTQLQQQIGYAGSSGSPSVGNVISAQA